MVQPLPILQQIDAPWSNGAGKQRWYSIRGSTLSHWWSVLNPLKNQCAASSSSDVELRLRSAIHTHLAAWHELVLSTVSPQSIDRAALKFEGYPGYYGYQGALQPHFTLVHWQQAILNYVGRLSSLSRCLSALKLLCSSLLELCVMFVLALHFI